MALFCVLLACISANTFVVVAAQDSQAIQGEYYKQGFFFDFWTLTQMDFLT